MGKKISKKDQERENEALLDSPNMGSNSIQTDLIKPIVNSGIFKPGHGGYLSKRYSDPLKLIEAIEAYFAKQDELEKPYTVSGLALSLGFNSRQSLLNYQKEESYEAFHEIMEKTRLKIEEQLETHLITKQNVAGAIFIMKNSYNYKDSTEVDLKSKNEFITQLVATPATGKEISHEG